MDAADELGSAVFVDSSDGPSMVEFGEGDGVVTITQTDGTLTVETAGDTQMQELVELDDEDLAEFDAAADACAEEHLPEGGWFDEVSAFEMD